MNASSVTTFGATHSATHSASYAAGRHACRTRRPTICHVLHSLQVGGAEVLAARLAEKLSDGYQFMFVCLDEIGTLGKRLQERGFQVEALQRRPGFDRQCARRLSAIWPSHNVAIVHAHQYTPFFYSLAGSAFARRPKVLFTEHGRFFPDRASWKRILFNRALLRRGDRIVGVGHCVKQALVGNEGIPAHRIDVIYNGVDPRAFESTRADRDQVRRNFGLSNVDFVIAHVARLDPIKDHRTGLHAVERLVPSHPNIRLLIVGDGPQRQCIEREVAGRGLHRFVRMLGSRDDVPRLLNAADLFVLTSVSEGIPVTLLEAMAAGVPVVATGAGGVPEVVRSGESGLLAPVKDDEALAAAIERCVTDDRLRNSLAQAGRARVADLFNEQRMHAAYADVYEEMLGG